MAGVGLLTGLISSLPSPLPDLRLDDPEILINAEGIPLHAGIAFGAGLAIMLWLWANRDFGKCLLAMALTLMGWLAAVNTANDVMSAVVGSELFGTVEGAKASREMLGWILAGLVGGGDRRRAHRLRHRHRRPSHQAPGSLGPDRRHRRAARPAAVSGRKARHHHASIRAVAGRGRRLGRLWADPRRRLTGVRRCAPRPPNLPRR